MLLSLFWTLLPLPFLFKQTFQPVSSLPLHSIIAVRCAVEYVGCLHAYNTSLCITKYQWKRSVMNTVNWKNDKYLPLAGNRLRRNQVSVTVTLLRQHFQCLAWSPGNSNPLLLSLSWSLSKSILKLVRRITTDGFSQEHEPKFKIF